MAQDDNYKEGVDFEWVQGNNDENSGFKTRHFFTKAEKEARKNPKPAAPKAAAPKPKLKGITTPKITTKKIDQYVRPEGKPSGMPKAKPKSNSLGTRYGTAVGNLAADTMKAIGKYTKPGDGGDMPSVDAMGNATGYKRGGTIKEGSAKDMREDKAMAKKRGMTMKSWEKSAADKKHDAPKKMATGGSVRGAGCATRGKGFAGTF